MRRIRRMSIRRRGGLRHRSTRSLRPMGFNPHRKMAKTPADYAMVIGAVVVCVLLLAWAFLG